MGKKLVILVVGIIAPYTIEHWREKRQWVAFRSEWEAKGERFEKPEFATVPDKHYTLRTGDRPALWSIGENQENENGFLGDSDDIMWHYEIARDDPDHPDRIAEREAREALDPKRKRSGMRRNTR